METRQTPQNLPQIKRFSASERMEFDQSRIDDLVSRPSESLNVEIKRWINPDELEGIAKIVKATFAIRNRNGGFFLIGFEDKTLLPAKGAPPDVHAAFNLDKIQGIVSKFASETFEIGVGFGNRDGQEYPVFVIPNGVRTVVAVKRDLKDVAQSKTLIREGEVYCRTLGSNGTPSTAVARPDDWADIFEICFENREADIGRFLRRHLSGKEITSAVEFLTGLKSATPTPNLRDRAEALLNQGEQRFQKVIAGDQHRDIIKDRGAWSVALAIDPPRTNAISDQHFLNAAMAGNPNYIPGWPVWLDSRTFADQAARPQWVEKAANSRRRSNCSRS
jgi:hypothetical protein